MAKALFGHVRPWPRRTSHHRDAPSARASPRPEHEVARLEAANAALRNGLAVDDDMLTLSVPDSVASRSSPLWPDPAPHRRFRFTGRRLFPARVSGGFPGWVG